MIVRIDVSVFEELAAHEGKALRSLLQQLVDHGDNDVLRLVPETDEIDPAGALDRWLKAQGELGAEVRELLALGSLQEAALPLIQPGHQRRTWRRAPFLDVTVERRSQSDWPGLRLTLGDAVDLAREPLHLRYEDERNDSAFVGWLASSNRRDLLALMNAPGRVAVHGGGSGGIKRWLNELGQIPTLSAEQQRRLWRTWVLFDKDAGDLDAREPSGAAITIMDLCEEVIRLHRIPFTWVCLQRREIESYLPDEGMRSTAAAGSTLAAKRLREWRSRPDHQHLAWAYDMKRGLMGDLTPDVSTERRRQLEGGRDALPSGEELKAPFRGLDRETRRILRDGFGGNVLNAPLHASPPPGWLHQLANEYDRGPLHQLPREALIQSIFDRV